MQVIQFKKTQRPEKRRFRNECRYKIQRKEKLGIYSKFHDTPRQTADLKKILF